MYCYNCMCKNPDDAKICMKCGKKMIADNHPHHLKPGTILDNKYLVGNAIGEGGFGITYVGLDLTLDMKIAIKEFYPSGYANRNNTVSNNVTLNFQNEGEYFKTGRESFLREAKSIAKFHDEKSIVDVRAFFEENETAYIIMEYLDGENLSDRLKNVGTFEPAELFRLFIPIMQTLEKMHRENIIHRDISPENVRMISDGTLKLMDFGSARYYAGMEKKTMSIEYKPGYAPYEQYNKSGNQGPWTDVYGLCATIYRCITGVAPVDSLERCQHDTLKKPSELGVNIAENLESVLMYGLAIYPDNRCPNMEELVRITEDALHDRKTVFGFSGSSTTQENINKTKAADEHYKTEFTLKTGRDKVIPEEPVKTEHRLPEISLEKTPEKKKNIGLIVACIVLAVVVIGAAVGIFMLLNQKKDTPSEETSETETVETTAEPTTIATEPSTEPPLLVPGVTGMKSSDAINSLSRANLKCNTTFDYSESVPEDYVIKQTPDSGTQTVAGSTISIVISRGAQKTEPPAVQSSKESSESSKTSSVSSAPLNSGSGGDATMDRNNLRASSRYLTIDDISWMNEDQLQLSINEIYAKHGFRFGDAIRPYFESFSWYHPDTNSMETVAGRMNQYEKANINLMHQYKKSISK